jgi:hypothetical protein
MSSISSGINEDEYKDCREEEEEEEEEEEHYYDCKDGNNNQADVIIAVEDCLLQDKICVEHIENDLVDEDYENNTTSSSIHVSFERNDYVPFNCNDIECSTVSSRSEYSSIKNDDETDEEDEDHYECPLNQLGFNEKRFFRAKHVKLQNSDYEDELFLQSELLRQYRASPPIKEHPPQTSCVKDDHLEFVVHCEEKECTTQKKRKRQQAQNRTIECWYSEPIKVDVTTLVWADHHQFGFSCGRIIDDPSIKKLDKDYMCMVEFFNLPKFLPRPSKKPFAQSLRMNKKSCVRRWLISDAKNEEYYEKLKMVLIYLLPLLFHCKNGFII